MGVPQRSPIAPREKDPAELEQIPEPAENRHRLPPKVDCIHRIDLVEQSELGTSASTDPSMSLSFPSGQFFVAPRRPIQHER